jgi:hypothetical protein
MEGRAEKRVGRLGLRHKQVGQQGRAEGRAARAETWAGCSG